MVQSIETVSNALREWVSQKDFVGVEFQSRPVPAKQTNDDYQVVWEFRFHPISLKKAALEVLLTSGGAIAVGVERWKRLAERTSLATIVNRYVGGFEPRHINLEEIIRICETVSGGKIEASACGFMKRLIACDVAWLPGFDLTPISRATFASRALSKALGGSRLHYQSWSTPDLP